MGIRAHKSCSFWWGNVWAAAVMVPAINWGRERKGKGVAAGCGAAALPRAGWGVAGGRGKVLPRGLAAGRKRGGERGMLGAVRSRIEG